MKRENTYISKEKKVNAYKKQKTNYLKGVTDTIKGIAAVGIMAFALDQSTNNYLAFSEKDYQNANWIETSISPNEAYNSEDIPHNIPIKEMFLDQVKKKNGKLEGKLLFPDLDGNGKIGK